VTESCGAWLLSRTFVEENDSIEIILI